jgi:hypothetical protein
MKLRVASFDIGKKNFCIYVEEFDAEKLQELKTKPLIKVPKVPTEKHQEIVDGLLLCGMRLLWQNVNLVQIAKDKISKHQKKDENIPQEILFRVLWSVLSQRNELWDTIDIFLVEHQVVFNRVEIQLLAQTCYTYFMARYDNTRPVLYWKNSLKTKLLLCPKEIDGKKVDIKKWTPNLALQTMKRRNDTIAVETLTSAEKKDDLGDSFCQLQSFKYWLLSKN